MKALIVDDEFLAGKHLEQQLRKHCPAVGEITNFTSPVEALEDLKVNVYDVVFLDVEMPQMTCFDFLEKTDLPPQTALIVVTAYAQYAIEAFKAEAIHYLLKPIDPAELRAAVDRIQKRIVREEVNRPGSPTISVYSGDRYLIIKREKIVRLEADGSYTVVILKDGQQKVVSKRLGYFESILESPPFFRCHNSHMVNANCIESIDNGRSGFVQLEDGTNVPVSQHYKPGLKAFLNI